MKALSNMKSRWFLPALAALAVVGTASGYAAHVYAAGEDCCHEGSPCCQPGGECCAARHKAAHQS